MSRARSPLKYRAVEHRNQQEVEKVPKQTETQEYWFQKNIFFHLSLQLLQLGDFPLTFATKQKKHQTYHQMATIYYTLNTEKQKSFFADKLFLQLSLSPLFPPQHCFASRIPNSFLWQPVQPLLTIFHLHPECPPLPFLWGFPSQCVKSCLHNALQWSPLSVSPAPVSCRADLHTQDSWDPDTLRSYCPSIHILWGF